MEKISLTKSPFMCLSHLDKIKWKELHWLRPYDVALFDLALSIAISQVTGRGLLKPLSSHPIAASYRKVSSFFLSLTLSLHLYVCVCVCCCNTSFFPSNVPSQKVLR